MTKTALVTGASGFIGTHMVEVLLAHGYRVRATDVPQALGENDPRRGRYPDLLQELGVETVGADVTRPETLKGICAGVDEVYHIAAIFDYSAPQELLDRVNVEGTRHLLAEMEAAGGVKKLILWGAGGVYGKPIPERLPIREDDHPVAPNNRYQRSKWAQEQLVREWAARQGMPFSVVRPTGVYGPRSVYGFLPVLKQMSAQRKLRVPPNFTFGMPFVHVRDVCEAAVYLANRPASDGEAYNLDDDSDMNFVDFVKFVGDEFGRPVSVLPFPVPIPVFKAVAYVAALATGLWARYVSGGRPAVEKETLSMVGGDYRYSNAKLKGAGYQFRYPTARNGLRETISWYRQQGWLPEKNAEVRAQNAEVQV